MNYHKLELLIPEDLYKQLEYVVQYKKSKDFLFNETNSNATIEEFILGCSKYYLKQIKHVEDISGINSLSKPFKIKNRLGEYLEEIKMPQARLAEKTGIDPSNISNFKSNRNQPSLDYFLRIWIALECPPLTKLFYREVEDESR